VTRRQLLAGVGWCLAAVAVQAGSDPRRQDLLLEEQISRAQKLSLKAGQTYQKWLNGALHTKPAESQVKECLSELGAVQQRAIQLASTTSRGAIAQWGRLQKQELNFFLREFVKRTNQAELQKRWQQAVDIQAQLLEARRRQLPALLKPPVPSGLLAYYQWKSAILTLLQAELELAREVAEAFDKRDPDSGMARKSVSLYQKAMAMRPPAACVRAQKLYVARFESLGALCGTVLEAIAKMDQDTVSNLQVNEAIYREKAAASDDASLAALKGLFH